MKLRDRVKALRRVKASEIQGAPWNWRVHTPEQTEAVAASIEELGYYSPVLVRELPGGGVQAFDGHLRRDLLDARIGPDTLIPIIVTDLDESEAKKANALHDPLSAMAERDEAKLAALMKEIELESAALQQLLEQEQAAAAAGGKPAPDVELKYSVLIDCGESEENQLAVLAGLEDAGVEAKAICAGFPKVDAKPATDPPAVEAKGRVIKRETKIKRTPRVKQLEGLFDVPPAKRSEHEWRIDFELDRPWQIGLIVGPSGSGKSTIARELFGDRIVNGWPWPADASIIDGFPAGMSIHDITGLLSSVGFSSPPNWLKPFQVLSNGEQFRVALARTLAEAPELAVVDEFTSVVDRTVAQIGSHALAKTVRASNRRFVAVACHYDIEEWLQPDWKYDTASGKFLWRSLRRRPELQIRIRRCDTSIWPVFARHHYLSHNLHRAAACFIAEIGGRPAAFASVLHNPHKGNGWWREHRTVCLPDFQGVGLGNALSEFVASLYVATGKEYRSTTTHPAMIRHRCKSRIWELIRAPALGSAPVGNYRVASTSAWNRPSAGFRFIGHANAVAAKRFGVID